ncbi:MAG: hypothetical protein ABH873_01965 [Candidatus Firestonebacteria bacterium]
MKKEINVKEEFKKIRAEIDKVAQTQKVLAVIIRFSVTVTMGLFIYLAMLGLNYAYPLPTRTAQFMFYGLLTTIFLMIVFYVVKPFFDKIDEESLALMIEKKYPQLLDRFICSIEMNQEEAAKIFSPQLIKALWVDTDKVKKALKLDLRKALALARGKRYVVLAMGLFLLAFIGSFIAPEFILKSTTDIPGVSNLVRNLAKQDLSKGMEKQKQEQFKLDEKGKETVQKVKDLLEQQKKLNQDMKKSLQDKKEQTEKKMEELQKKNPELAKKPWLPGKQIKFNPPKTGGLSGIVTMNGKPVEGIYVAARNYTKRVAPTGKTDENGKYVINNLITDGMYSMWVVNADYTSVPEGYRGGVVVEANRVRDGYNFGIMPKEAAGGKGEEGGIELPPEFPKHDFNKKDKSDMKKLENALAIKVILPDADEEFEKKDSPQEETPPYPQEKKMKEKLDEMAKDLEKQQEQQEQNQEKKEAAEQMKDLAQKMEEMQNQENQQQKSEEQKQQENQEAQKKMDELSQKLEEMNKKEQNELQKEVNKEMADQLKDMKEEMKKNDEFKKEQNELAKKTDEQAKKEEMKDKESQEKLKDSKEEMDESKKEMEKTEMEKALEKSLEAEKKLEEALEKLMQEQMEKSVEEKKEGEKKDAEKAEKKEGEKKEDELSKEKIDELQKKLEEAAKKADEQKMSEEELKDLLKQLEEAMKELEKKDKDAANELKKEMEELKKEAKKPKESEAEMKKEDKEKKDGAYKRWRFIGKKLEMLGGLFGELKNRVELFKEYGVDEDIIADMKKENIPTRYKKLVDKYYQSLSKEK